MTSRGSGYLLAISLEPLDAPTALFFGHLAERWPETVRVVRYGHPDLAGAVAQASAIVLVRGLFEFSPVIRCARALGIPLYYFLDDNFVVLRERGGPGAAFVARYSADNVRTTLRGFAGVLLATPPLVDFFSEQRLHPHLFLFPPAANPDPLPRAAPWPGLRVAFFGGRHLHATFLNTVVPAIRRVARERPVTLLAVGLPEAIPPSAGLSVIVQPYDESYSRGLNRLAAAGVDMLVHPQAAGLANNAYKNPHALISAHALGAVPIVSDSAPYHDLGPECVAILCGDAEDSWYQALARTANDESLRSTVQVRLATYCADHFGGSLNREVLDRILPEHTPFGRGRTLLAHCVARACLLMSLAGRAASRVRKGIELASVVAAG